MKLYFFILITLIFSGCANIVAPTGGAKDKEAPNCIEHFHQISKLNKKHESKLTYMFDERIQEHKFVGNFYISPPLNGVSHKIKSSTLEIIIKDFIDPNLQYEVSLGNCLKDLTEGNVLTEFIDEIHLFNKEINFQPLEVFLQKSLTHEDEKDHWVLLYNSEISDSLIFKTTPNYVGKTDINGHVFFNNIIDGSYKIVSVSGEDYIYHEEEIISFSDEIIIAGIDSSIHLFTFNPIYRIDSTEIVKDTTITEGGTLTLKSDFSGDIIIQLLKGSNVILQKQFENIREFNLKNISTGEYSLRAFHDENKNGYWDTGNFMEKKQAEQMYYYPEKITIRENWDLELDWITKE